MKKQRKPSGTLFEDSIPLYFRGDVQLFKFMQLKVQTTVNLQKPHQISLPLKLFNYQKQQDFVEPLAQIQTFDEMSRQNLLKNKSLIKEGIFYIYFPSNVRVDEKIFKIYDKNYQSFVKDVPKSFRQNFAKFIIWEDGTGDHSVNFLRQKLQDLLSNTIKVAIEKKIQTFNNQITNLQNLDLNPKVLKSLFVVRNKISSVYKQLKLAVNSSEHLTNLYQDILTNHKKFINLTASKQTSIEKVIYKSPFIVKDINKVFQYFDTKQNYLKIVNFCFLKMLQIHLDINQQVQGMKKFKQHLEYIINHIFNNITCRQQDIIKNIWIIETLDQGLKLIRSKLLPPVLNPQKEQQLSLLNVSVCGQYRNAVERIGIIFYGLNTYCVFPRNLEYQLNLCIKAMNGEQLSEEEYPELKTINRHQQINKLQFLSGEPINQTIELVLNNFNTYKLIYVRTLELMEKVLSQSPYKKVSWSMKLSVLKSTIIYFTIKDQKRLSVQKLLEQDKIFSYESKKSVWEKLQIINKVYRLTLCKRYNIKMGVQDLLNIILDDSIIHLEKIWKELVKIISELLFEYKIGETQQQTERLNSIDYGQGQEQQNLTVRKRRRTTIHRQVKQIQVGTLKFISLFQGINQSESDQLKINKMNIKNDSLRLNIQLSNRIVSYAVALIQKSQAKRLIQKQNNKQQSGQCQSNPSQKELISLKFLIRSSKGQKMQIPFQILQTQDKFIQVQIKSKQVIIFKIQKLLVEISDNITLVYTMPINHEKLQFSEKYKNLEQEQHYYVNISPELKINTLQLYQPVVIKTQLESQFKNRKQSTSSTTSKPNSQSSVVNSVYLLYKKLWNPLKFMFNFDKNDEIQIQQIQIECQDDIYSKVFIGQRQVNFKQQKNFKIQSTNDNFKFPLIIFIKPNQKAQSNKQGSNYPNLNKKHKQSFNFLPKSLRNRSQSFTKSIMSGSVSNSGIDSNRVLIRLSIIHNGYKYEVNKQISYGKRSPFKVDYRYSQEFQQYTIKNLCQQELEIFSETETFDLYPYEQLKVFSHQVKICLKYEEENQDSQSDQEQTNLMKILKLDELVDLKTMIKKQHLKPQKLATIWFSLEQMFAQNQPEIYSIFKPIRILAQQKGYISILKWNTSEYQLIGKIQGMIDYTEQEKNNFLELMLVPTKKGTISMPQISINSRKGVWKNGKTIRVG